MNFNQVMLGGRLTRDPEHKTLANGTEVTSFGMAINRKWKSAQGEQREEALFVDVEFYGKRAGTVAQHFTKGKPIFVQGRLKLDEWEHDGQRKTKMKVIGDDFSFVGDGPRDGNREGAPPPKRAPEAKRAPAPAPAQAQADDGFSGDEDIPF